MLRPSSSVSVATRLLSIIFPPCRCEFIRTSSHFVRIPAGYKNLCEVNSHLRSNRSYSFQQRLLLTVRRLLPARNHIPEWIVGHIQQCFKSLLPGLITPLVLR